MNKIAILLTIIVSSSLFAHGLKTGKDSSFKNKIYVFYYNSNIQECDGAGNILMNETNSPKIAYKGSTFTVEDEIGDVLVIKFGVWNLPKQRNKQYYSEQLSKRSNYNFKNNPELSFKKHSFESIRYFRITKEEFNNSCTQYVPKIEVSQFWKRIDFTFGTLTIPFKIRSLDKPNKLVFTPNLSIGGAIYSQYKVSEDFSFGFVGGISVSSITLDSASTEGVVKVNHSGNSRPSLTFTGQFLAAYKTINLTVGLGWDYINIATNIERSWIYQGKPWLGIGIGVSLFNEGTAPEKTENN